MFLYSKENCTCNKLCPIKQKVVGFYEYVFNQLSRTLL